MKLSKCVFLNQAFTKSLPMIARRLHRPGTNKSSVTSEEVHVQLTNAQGVHDLCDVYDAEPRFLGGLDYPAKKTS